MAISPVKVILWDFDGVIIDSMPIRDQGFRQVLKNFPLAKVDKLLNYHRANGGLSRYAKFRYFYEQILNQPMTEKQIATLAANFSVIMQQALTDKKLLISDSLTFIKKHYQRIAMYIVSGSDQTELRLLCGQLGIDQYFSGLYGSPIPKTQLVKKIIDQSPGPIESIVLVGDAINDYEAAKENGITFWGYNNDRLKDRATVYVERFSQLTL